MTGHDTTGAPGGRPERRCQTCNHHVIANAYAKEDGTVWGRAAEHTTAYCLPCPYNPAPLIGILRASMGIKLLDNWTEVPPHA